MHEQKVSEETPELHHYTDKNGLEGIIKSKSLWSVHYKALNDYTEVGHLKDNLAYYVSDRLKNYIIDEKRKNKSLALRVSRDGGAYNIANAVARDSVDSFYEVTFEGRLKKGGRRTPAFGTPFITSFCSHADDSEYEKKNGLLSQWFGYGGDDAFAIVFDTKKLEELLLKDSEVYKFYFGGLSSVIYNDENLDFQSKFSDVIDGVYNVAKDLLFDPKNAKPEDAFEHLVRAACRFKHRAFREEREIRVICCPATDELEGYLKTSEPDLYEETGQKLKNVLSNPKPHICLFGLDITKKLPIKRIIVGPGSRQKESVSFARTLVGSRIPVVPSETPYRR